MKQFLAQFHKDFSSYFSGYIAYIILIAYYILSFFSALYFGDYFVRETDVMNAYFVIQPTILALIIPAITMRSWADEIKSGTIEILLTQPISFTILVLAKFFASFAFFIFLLLFSIPFLLITNAFSVLDMNMVLMAYMGLILSGALFVSLGCLISVLCRTSITSFVCSLFVLVLVLQFNFTALNTSKGSVPFDVLNFNYNYEAFLSGALFLGNIFYFILGTVLVLWLNLVAVQYRFFSLKKEKFGFRTFACLLILIFISACLCCFLFSKDLIDVTHHKDYTLTGENQKFLHTFDKRIDITLYESKSKREDVNSRYASYASYAERLLQQIEKYSHGSIRYSVVRVNAFSSMERRLVQEGILFEEDSFGNKIYMALDFTDNNGNRFTINALEPLRKNFLETDIMRVVRSFGLEKKNIALITSASNLEKIQGFTNFLKEFYNLSYLTTSLEFIPPVYDAVILINPQEVSFEFLLAVDQYVLNGGNIIFFSEPEQLNRNNEFWLNFLHNFGIRPIPQSTILSDNQPLGLAEIHHSELSKDIRSVLVNGAGEISIYQPSSFKLTSILQLNNKPIAVFSEGMYQTNYPELAFEIPEVLSYSAKSGKFLFFYDTDILKDSMYIINESKSKNFYQIISLTDNLLFLQRLMDYVLENHLETHLNYRHYPINLISIGNAILNIQKQRMEHSINELQQKIDSTKKSLASLKNTSVKNMGKISELSQTLEDTEDELNRTKQLTMDNYQAFVGALTFIIVLFIPAVLLCLLIFFIRLYRKSQEAKIRRLITHAKTH